MKNKSVVITGPARGWAMPSLMPRQGRALRYELPPEAMTLPGYIVRRMHKTRWIVGARLAAAPGA